MRVNGIDHVNIVAEDLEATVAFYEQVMGLRREPNPAIGRLRKGAWLRDDDGGAVIHLVERQPAPAHRDGARPDASGHALHHVAFRCSGFEETCRRLDALGLAYRAGHQPATGLRQIFLTDPNAINLEFNFRGE